MRSSDWCNPSATRWKKNLYVTSSLGKRLRRNKSPYHSNKNIGFYFVEGSIGNVARGRKMGRWRQMTMTKPFVEEGKIETVLLERWEFEEACGRLFCRGADLDDRSVDRSMQELDQSLGLRLVSSILWMIWKVTSYLRDRGKLIEPRFCTVSL